MPSVAVPPPATAPPAPPAPPPPQPTEADPHSLAFSMNRLSAGLTGGPRKSAKPAALILAVVLREGEVVECLVTGTLLGQTGVAALTDQRLVFVTEREWTPDVFELALDRGLDVAGAQDERTATLTFTSGPHTVRVEKISDRPLAVEMAQRIRAKTAG